MNEARKVTIDGVDYVPASALSGDVNETAKAIIEMLVGGYYTSTKCHITGNEADPSCVCSGCHAYRVAVAFIGEMKGDEINEPGFVRLYEAAAR